MESACLPAIAGAVLSKASQRSKSVSMSKRVRQRIRRFDGGRLRFEPPLSEVVQRKLDVPRKDGAYIYRGTNHALVGQ